MLGRLLKVVMLAQLLLSKAKRDEAGADSGPAPIPSLPGYTFEAPTPVEVPPPKPPAVGEWMAWFVHAHI